MFRASAVSGTWYPDDPARLAADVDRYLAAAPPTPDLPQPRAVIVPHAGLMYSGPVAAFAYALVTRASYRSIVLVGPSHFVPFTGVSLWGAGEWQTPFGAVAVDGLLAEAVRTECRQIVNLPAAHRREHSLEMQLPFIAHLLPGVSIVPLLMGEQTRETAFALGDALARALTTDCRVRGAADPDVLLIASSDLSHYERAPVAARMDAIIARHVAALDPESLMIALEQEPRHACGGGPMVSVLQAARAMGASTSRVLHYADSGDVSGDKSSVVGYLAAALW